MSYISWVKKQPTWVILRRNWRADPLTSKVSIRCSCGQVSTYPNKRLFDKEMRIPQGRLLITTTCGCFKKEPVYLEDYHEQKDRNTEPFA